MPGSRHTADAELRRALDLDSLDFLNFVVDIDNARLTKPVSRTTRS
jgi:hypothetical protein